jgi:hypothetical protein
MIDGREVAPQGYVKARRMNEQEASESQKSLFGSVEASD